LLSSDYIPEENEIDEESDEKEIQNKVLSKSPPSQVVQVAKKRSKSITSRKTVSTTSSQSSSSDKMSAQGIEMPATDIDRLYNLVQELKEEDLNNYRKKIEEQKLKSKRKSSSSEDSFLPSESPKETQVIDLQKVLVPTTTQIINAVPQVGPIVLERSKSPVVLELATASLDLVLPATEMKCKIQPLKTPDKETQSPISKTFPDIILEPTSQSEVQSAMAN